MTARRGDGAAGAAIARAPFPPLARFAAAARLPANAATGARAAAAWHDADIACDDGRARVSDEGV